MSDRPDAGERAADRCAERDERRCDVVLSHKQLRATRVSADLGDDRVRREPEHRVVRLLNEDGVRDGETEPLSGLDRHDAGRHRRCRHLSRTVPWRT